MKVVYSAVETIPIQMKFVVFVVKVSVRTLYVVPS